MHYGILENINRIAHKALSAKLYINKRLEQRAGGSQSKPCHIFKKKHKMIHLIVGNTGSGKTTYANELKRRINGIIFSIDKWNNTLFLPDKTPEDGLEWFLERIERAEQLILDLIHQLENSKTDTILDLGLSKFEHREKFRKFAEVNGYELRLHFIDISKTTRLQRVMKRNNEKGATFEFEVTKENFDFMETWFETPTENEMVGGVVISENS